MGEHLVSSADHLIKPQSLQSLQSAEASASSGEGGYCSHATEFSTCTININKEEEENDAAGEEEPLIQTVECRICQEEDSIKNLEAPCTCSGSLKVP